MSAEMAIEAIAAEYAKLLGYFTEIRVPYKVKRGNSDIDVLGYNPKTKKILMIECKAGGGPNDYPSDDYRCKKWYREEFKIMMKKWEAFKKSPTNKWGIKKLDEMWFVISASCDDNKKIEKELYKVIHIKIKIIPIHELLLDIINEVKKDKDIRRTRYSNPALEFCRWFIRGHNAGKIDLIDLDKRLKK